MSLKHKHTDSAAHEFRLLRNRIESDVHAPALIFVTSATDTDGAGFAAHGIAEALSKTHQRTVLVTSDSTLITTPTGAAIEIPQRRRASDKLEPTELRPQVAGGFSVICLSLERVATISRSRVADMIRELREKNDYVVVDGGDLMKNGLGLLLVGAADATTVAFRSGRAEQAEDRLLLDALERAESKVIGVVMTDQASIDAFHQRNTDSVVATQFEAPTRVPVLKRLELAISRLVKSS